MTKTETAQLLTFIAAFDRRTIGEADVEAWHLILADADATDCAEAVRQHFATSREWLMPADVNTGARAVANRRVGRQRRAALEAEIAAENPPAELTSRERPLLALMAGTPVKSAPRPSWKDRQRQIPVSSKPPFTAEELAAARAELDKAGEAS